MAKLPKQYFFSAVGFFYGKSADTVPTRSTVGSVDWQAVAFNPSTSLPAGRKSGNSRKEVDLSLLAPRLSPCFKGFSLGSSIFLSPQHSISRLYIG